MLRKQRWQKLFIWHVASLFFTLNFCFFCRMFCKQGLPSWNQTKEMCLRLRYVFFNWIIYWAFRQTNMWHSSTACVWLHTSGFSRKKNHTDDVNVPKTRKQPMWNIHNLKMIADLSAQLRLVDHSQMDKWSLTHYAGLITNELAGSIFILLYQP